RVTVTYPDAAAPSLRDVDLQIDEGELCLVAGTTGAGKSTLLRCINGLVPHFTGGRLAGRVTVDGRDTREHRPRDLADVVGYVGQDPLAGFVTDTVEDELAYGMESLGVAPAVMRRRVEETLDLLGLVDVRDRPLLDLSAGQQQRVAIGAVLTVQPRVLVLDEPTSALDPPAAEDVLAVLTRLVHDLGLTVVVAEHRLERVVQYADRLLLVDGQRVTAGDPADLLAEAPVAPPVVELGRLLGWSPLPLSIREARRRASRVKQRLSPAPQPAPQPAGPVVAWASKLWVSHRDVPALRGVDFAIRGGEIVALMGRNGAGKTTLLSALAGLLRPDTGRAGCSGRVVLVPHQPGDLLWAQTVAQECRAADRDAGVPAGSTRELLTELEPGIADEAHPNDLSEGQRLSLALAVMLAGGGPLIALDEPTRGLDYAAKHRLVRIVRRLAANGRAVLLATHDVELVAQLADRVVLLADGDVVTDGPARDVVLGSPAFAPQVAKVMAPLPLLTVADVAAARSAGEPAAVGEAPA
ncbi:MAG TPA: ATP-binding cassette domain-containing protein, partial [Mycobacteriales bacterium]|nr:ATP-binding cassette domain-containing protein [Mycobacteriales bacterium]